MTTQHPALRPSFLSQLSSQGEDNRATCRSGGKSVPGCHRIPGSMQHGPGADDFRGELSSLPPLRRAPRSGIQQSLPLPATDGKRPGIGGSDAFPCTLERQAWLHRRWPGRNTPSLARHPKTEGLSDSLPNSELRVRVERPPPANARHAAEARHPAAARQAAAGRGLAGRSEFGVRIERPTLATARHPPEARQAAAGWRRGGRSSELGARSSNSSARQPATARHAAEARQARPAAGS